MFFCFILFHLKMFYAPKRLLIILVHKVIAQQVKHSKYSQINQNDTNVVMEIKCQSDLNYLVWTKRISRASDYIRIIIKLKKWCPSKVRRKKNWVASNDFTRMQHGIWSCLTFHSHAEKIHNNRGNKLTFHFHFFYAVWLIATSN